MPRTDWLGLLPVSSLASYIDGYLLMILGGVPWQVYFQRILACKTPRQAQNLSYAAAIGCILLAIPPAFLGSIARVAGTTVFLLTVRNTLYEFCYFRLAKHLSWKEYNYGGGSKIHPTTHIASPNTRGKILELKKFHYFHSLTYV